MRKKLWSSSKQWSVECVAPPHRQSLRPPSPLFPPLEKTWTSELDTEARLRRRRVAKRKQENSEERKWAGRGEEEVVGEDRAALSNRSTWTCRTSASATAPVRKWYSGTVRGPAGSLRPTMTRSSLTSFRRRSFLTKTHPCRPAVGPRPLTTTSRFWTTASFTTRSGSTQPGSVAACSRMRWFDSQVLKTWVYLQMISLKEISWFTSSSSDYYFFGNLQMTNTFYVFI